MVKKIVISSFNNIAAILHNNRIQEFIIINHGYQVNDIYIGIVQKIFSSINAAFIKLGHNLKSGFIHASDIRRLKKKKYDVNVADILFMNQLILVQIIKEPTNNKGPRLTTNITLSGRYVVLMPFGNTVCVSDKIHDQNERIHLHSLGILIKPSSMGILIRSSAQGITENDILEDLNYLKKQWNFIEKASLYITSPSLIYKEEDLIRKTMSNYYENSIKKIITDSEEGFKKVRLYLTKWQYPICIDRVKIQLYSRPECLLDKFYIKHTIIDALKSKVYLGLGGHIVIEKSEALTVIDVNSGSFNKSDNSKETILRTNFYAAIEIAHQLKIRNINGVIIIDFIDMQSAKDQLRLLEHFNQLLEQDSARPQIIQLSELGLVELTRRRRGQSLEELFISKNHDYLNLETNFIFHYSYYNTQHQWGENFFINQNKSIRSLFFTKKLKRRIFLEKKKFSYANNKRYKSEMYIGKKNSIHFIHPQRNYLAPLILYSQIIYIDQKF